MAVALWDIVGKASNLVQLLGLDAFTLISIAMSCLRLREVKDECRKVEERMRLLQVLLSSPAGCWVMAQDHLELGRLVTSALRDAHGLVASYNESTLFSRIRRGRSMARQFQDLYSRIDYYCGLIVTVNACLLVVQANPPRPSVARAEVNDDGDVPPSTGGYSTGAEISSAAPHGTDIIDVLSQE